MTHFLLSWHGTILCYEKTRLFAASVNDVMTGRASPLLLDQHETLSDGPDCLEVVTGVSQDPVRALALRSGDRYLTCDPDLSLRLSAHCDRWKFFLPLPDCALATLDVLASRTRIGQELRVSEGRLWEAALQLDETGFDPAGFTTDETGAIGHSPTECTLTPWPNETVGDAISSARAACDTGTDRPTFPVWARWEDLPGQVALTSSEPHEPAHLYILGRLCTLLDLFAEAHSCLDALKGAMVEADRLWAKSIVAKSAGDTEGSTALLSRAILSSATDRLDKETIRDCLALVQTGELNQLALWRDHWAKPLFNFDDTFNRALIPGNLPEEAAHHLKQEYYWALEDHWQKCPQSDRIRFLARETALNGESHALSVLRGHEKWLAGDPDAANLHYTEARKHALRSGMQFIHFNQGVFSWLTETTIAPDPNPLSLASWTWRAAPVRTTSPDLCIVAGCDTHYFRFIPKFIASLVQAADTAASPGAIHLYLGVVRPSAEQLEFLESCRATLEAQESNVSLGFAHGSLSYEDAASFTCVRYLMMPEIVRRTHCPILTCDMDAIIPRDFLSQYETLRTSFDYGFRLYAFDRQGVQSMGEPWGFGAGISYFGEPERLPLLANELHDYIVTAYRMENPTNWCIDQCALSAIYHRHLGPLWHELRIRFMDDDPALVVMPHHLGLDKQRFSAWDGIVDTASVFEALGLDPAQALRLGKPSRSQRKTASMF